MIRPGTARFRSSLSDLTLARQGGRRASLVRAAGVVGPGRLDGMQAGRKLACFCFTLERQESAV